MRERSIFPAILGDPEADMKNQNEAMPLWESQSLSFFVFVAERKIREEDFSEAAFLHVD